MTKQEFVDGLVVELNATGDYRLINENRQFYTEYIDGEIAKGRTESEVLEELGDPRLIANSILQASGYKDSPREDESTYSGKENGESMDDGLADAKKAAFKLKLIIALVIFLLIAFIILIITLGIKIISFLAPVLLPLLIVWLLFSLIRRR